MEPMTYDTPGELELELRVPSGELVVRTSSTDRTTLHITGERDVNDISVRFEPAASGPARLVVAQRGEGRGWRKFRNLTVEIAAPETTRLHVEGSSADLRAEGTLTSLVFRTASGDACVDDVRHALDLKTASGDLRARSIGGPVVVSTASGDVWVDTVQGDLDARTASGDVSLGGTVGDVRITTVSGDVVLSNAGPGVTEVRTVSGDVQVGVAPQTRAHLDVSSLSGDTSSELPVSDAPVGDDGQELELRVTSTSGDVRIRRGDGPPPSR